MTSANGNVIPFWEPQVGCVESALVQQVLDSNYLNDGDVTARFEQHLATLLGAKHVVTTTSGTTALWAALLAVGIGRGDEVLVPDLTFIATANAVSMAGATPVLVDVDPDTLTICPKAAAEVITNRTRAIIPVHVSGRAAEMTAIDQLAAKHDLKVIEDAAEAFASRAADRQALGTIGHAGCYSFSPNKIITTGQGGAVATNDDAIARRLRELKDQGRATRGTGGDDEHVSIGFNLKFTNLQAAVGLGQLELLAARQKRMREILELYVSLLHDLKDIRIIGFGVAEMPLWIDALAEDRDALDQHLRSARIYGRRFWRPLHTQAPYQRGDAHFPASTGAAGHAYWLPSSFLLRNEQIKTVCEQIRSFYRSGTRRHAEAA